jgi:GNAT superfamily N-acetyltransferase
MLEFRELNRRQLLKYVESDQFGEGRDIPISFHRAIAQTKNPRLGEEDILLVLALEKDQLVGYAGVLPDTYFGDGSSEQKIGWLSCLWVSPTNRGFGIGQSLIEKSLELWDGNILSADYAPETKKLYDQTSKFNGTPLSLQGIRLYVKSDLENLLPPKHAAFGSIKPVLKILDFIVNTAINLRLLFVKQDISSLNTEFVDSVDEEIEQLIQAKQENQLFKRGKEELNWMLQNPWILSAASKDPINAKYYFSSVVKSFEYKVVKIRNSSNTLTGFMILAIRNNSLKIPYLYHTDGLEDISMFLNHYLLKWKIKTFTIYHYDLQEHLRKTSSPALFKKTLFRNYMIPKKLNLNHNQGRHKIQDGDADCGFT